MDQQLREQPRQTTTTIQTRFDFLKAAAAEIADEIYKNVYDAAPCQIYNIVGMMAEERNIRQDEVGNLIVMVMSKMFINLQNESCKGHKQYESAGSNYHDKDSDREDLPF